MRRSIPFILALLLAGAPSWAGEPAGHIIAATGRPGLTRNGDDVAVSLVPGFSLGDRDTLRTGPNEQLTMELITTGRIPALPGDDSVTVRMGPDTIVVLVAPRRAPTPEPAPTDEGDPGAAPHAEGAEAAEPPPAQSAAVVTVTLLAGDVEIDARGLHDGEHAEVSTFWLTARISGGTVAVITGPVGGYLVIAQDSEGQAEVVDAAGEVHMVEAGAAVAVDGLQGGAGLVVHDAGRIGHAVAGWSAEREALVREDPQMIARAWTRIYLDHVAVFNDAYSALMAHRDVIDTWIEEERRSLVRAPGSVDEPSLELLDALLRATGEAAVLEPAALRLAAFGPVAGETVLARRFSTLRFIAKLYTQRYGEPVLVESDQAVESGDAVDDT